MATSIGMDMMEVIVRSPSGVFGDPYRTHWDMRTDDETEGGLDGDVQIRPR